MSDLIFTPYRPRTYRDPTLVSGFDATPAAVTSERGTAGCIAACEWCGMARGGGATSRRSSPVFLLIREAAVVLLTCAALFVAGGLA